MGERELRKKEGQWMYRMATLRPQGLNEDDGFKPRTERRARARAGDDSVIYDIFCDPLSNFLYSDISNFMGIMLLGIKFIKF